jgi:hypothetical protein
VNLASAEQFLLAYAVSVTLAASNLKLFEGLQSFLHQFGAAHNGLAARKGNRRASELLDGDNDGDAESTLFNLFGRLDQFCQSRELPFGLLDAASDANEFKSSFQDLISLSVCYDLATVPCCGPGRKRFRLSAKANIIAEEAEADQRTPDQFLRSSASIRLYRGSLTSANHVVDFLTLAVESFADVPSRHAGLDSHSVWRLGNRQPDLMVRFERGSAQRLTPPAKAVLHPRSVLR